jgi:hypothetical protein
MSRILKRLTISGCKMNIEFHGSLSSLVISKRSSIENIMNILLLRQKEPLRCGDLNPKKVHQRTNIRHKKLITKMNLNKGNVLRVITSDDHVIYVKKEKSPTMRWHMDEESWIMSPRKPSPRSPLKVIKGATNVTNHTLKDRIPRWWTHVNIFTQLTIKKNNLHIKLRDGPLPNRSHGKESVNSGHMSNMSKSVIIVMTLVLLKPTSNKINLIALKRTVRASLNLIDTLTSGRTNTLGTKHKIPRASTLKSSGCESQRRVTVRWPTKMMTTSNKLLWRGISRRGGLNRRRRWHVLNERRR